jgi:hypothetical protein
MAQILALHTLLHPLSLQLIACNPAACKHSNAVALTRTHTART